MLMLTVLLLLAGCGSRPPMAKVSSGDTEIPAELGTYSWKTFNRHIVADAEGPNDMMADKEAVTLEPGGEVKVSFSNKPKRLVLTRWVGNEAAEETELESNRFAVPAEAGEYVYGIRAEWSKHKSGTFAIKIKVE